MELPITRPSMMCYADEIKFPDLLNDLSTKKHNGFIRITAGSEEGFILFKNGKEIAASYIRYSRVDAIEKIKDAMEDKNSLIEIFDVRPNQINFFMDMNKPYMIGADAYDLIDEFKNPVETKKEQKHKAIPKPKPVSEALKESKNDSVDINETEENTVSKNPINLVSSPNQSNETKIYSLRDNQPISQPEIEELIKDTIPEIETIETVKEPTSENESVNEPSEENVVDSPKMASTEDEMNIVDDEISTDTSQKTDLNTLESSENNSEIISKDESSESQMDRSELMKKYGIKDIQEEDVTNILESYKGGSVDDEDVEKIELTLMNKIKKSTLAIPKIKGAEVMVFLDNVQGLTGKVNIIIESETKGFISRIMGVSDTNNLERQIIEISQIEIRKSFRKYPEIVDDFNINVEIS
jgi:hypothetical protein